MSLIDRTLDRFRAVPKAPLTTGQDFHASMRTVGAKIALSQENPDPREAYPTQMKLADRDVTFTPEHDHADGEAVIAAKLEWADEAYSYRLRGGSFPGERSELAAQSLASSFGDESGGRAEIDSSGRVVSATGVFAERGAIRDRVAPILDAFSHQGAQIERLGGAMAAVRLDEAVATVQAQAESPDISSLADDASAHVDPDLSEDARPAL